MTNKRAEYKRLGDYIEQVNLRNTDLRVNYLVGLTINKKFISSVANIIGTDLSNYKLIKKNQFACSLMQVSRDGKIPIAIFEDKIGIMSPAYPIFKIIDEKTLMPEYLMMWFERDEFDREAAYYAVGGVRGTLTWEDFCDLELPVPPITEQHKIVAEYQTIENKIKVNQQICEKLEASAQAIYKEWFVEKLDTNFEKTQIKDFGLIVTGKTPSSKRPDDFGNDMPFITPGDFVDYNKFALTAERGLSKVGYTNLKNKILPSGSVIVTCIGSDMGKVVIATQDCITNQQMNSIVVNQSYFTDYLYHHLQSISGEIKSIAMGGSTMPMLSKSNFMKIKILKPNKNILMDFENTLKPINKSIILHSNQNQKLTELKSLLLARMVK